MLRSRDRGPIALALAIVAALWQGGEFFPVPLVWAQAPGYSTAADSDARSPLPPARRGVDSVLEGPTLNEAPQAPPVPSPNPAPRDETLPINLATALQLSNARPLVIALAEASVARAAAQLQGASVLWVPDLHAGFDYYRHDGANQASDGAVIFDAKNAFSAGGGATLVIGVTDAIFRPLAARQELASRQWDVQSARNDALLAVALAYFDVQQARGVLAGSLDAVVKGEDLEKRITGLAGGAAGGLVPEIEIDRARTTLADFRQRAEASRAAWRVASTRLTRVLRLNPASVVVPMEPSHLQITLISADSVVDDLIPIGLTNRPELASQRALVQATLIRLRQERLRPLIPSAVLEGRNGPAGTLNGSIFGGGRNDGVETWGGRFDMDMGLVWSLYNLGLGNRSLVRERSAEQQIANLQFFNLQDQVAQEVVQALALVQAAAAQVEEAATGVKEARITFRGNLTGLGETRRVGDLNVPIIRPQEAVAALQALVGAYNNYYAAVNSYNRAQFQLYHALGFPSRILACERPPGDPQPVDMHRPPQMAPVCPHVVSSPDG